MLFGRKGHVRHVLYSLILALLALSRLGSAFIASSDGSQDVSSMLERLPPGTPRPLDEGFTMIIATYQRDQILHTLLHYLTKNPPPSLRHLVIIWQNIDVQELPEFLQPNELRKFLAPILRNSINIVVRKSKHNSMNERFRPLLDWEQDIPTEHVMIYDDDVVIPWTTIEWGYQRFLENSNRIVGFTARDYITPSERRGSVDDQDEEEREDTRGLDLEFSKVEYTFSNFRTYSMILSNAAFLRTDWLKIYWQEGEELQSLRHYVDEVFNCDDILINFIVSNQTRQAPLLLKSIVPIRTIPTKGLWNRDPDGEDIINQESSAEKTTTPTTTAATTNATLSAEPPAKLDHFTQRSQCLSHYFSIFTKYAPQHFTPSLSSSATSTIYPLLRSDYCISKQIEDNARDMKVGEDWNEPSWALDKSDFLQDAEEREERRRLEEGLEGMSEEELRKWLEMVDQDGALGGDDDEDDAEAGKEDSFGEQEDGEGSEEDDDFDDIEESIFEFGIGDSTGDNRSSFDGHDEL